MLRYVSYDLAARSCDCCGASLAYGAVVMSDERRYGRRCAARAAGGGRETAGQARKVAQLQREASDRTLATAWRSLNRASWTATSRRRIVLDELIVWTTPVGSVLEVHGSTVILSLRDRGYTMAARSVDGERAIFTDWPSSLL